MSTKTDAGKPYASSDHPNPIDKNRSILWARYLVDTEDWVILSTKQSKEEDSTMISIAVLDSKGQLAYEALVKPEGIVSNESIAKHGLETSTLFNAQPYPVIRESLIRLLSGKDVFSWNFEKQRQVLELLDKQFNMPPHEWRGNSVSHQYARFVGKQEGNKPGYVMPKLKTEGTAAQVENKSVLRIVNEMASSSQLADPLASGKPGWTAEFYRPKLSTGEKLRNLFGKR